MQYASLALGMDTPDNRSLLLVEYLINLLVRVLTKLDIAQVLCTSKSFINIAKLTPNQWTHKYEN